MVVDAVLSLDQDDLNEKLIGIKKVTGGGLQDSLFVNGVAFKKTFSYAGFEQQPKSFKDPKIVCLNVELELKSEKDNAEVRVDQVAEYQAIVDAEWQIIFNKLEALYETGAKVVLSKLPIGDLATQYVFSFLCLTNVDIQTDTSPTGTSSAPAASPPTTSNASSKPAAAQSPAPVPTSSPNISAPAPNSKSDKSATSASTSSKAAPPQRPAPWSSAAAPSNSSLKWSAPSTTPL